MRRLVTFFLVIPLLGALAAPAAAQPQTTTEELLSGMVTEEVEPGVFRVVNDGVRDLAAADDLDIVAGHDGGIWLLRRRHSFRLGSDEWLAWPTTRSEDADFEVAPDGTVWTVPRQADDAIRSFDGECWTTHHDAEGLAAIEVTPDGTVWAIWRGPESPRQQHFGYLDEDGWQTLGSPDDARQLLVTGPDDIWATAGGGFGPPDVVRFVDGAWQRLVGMEGTEATWQRAEDPVDTEDLDMRTLLAALGPDGTFWGVFIRWDLAVDDDIDLSRFDGSEWSRWSLVDTGFGPGTSESQFEVAPDGSVWFGVRAGPGGGPYAPCDGVTRFDGVTWDRYLAGLCVRAIDITADGGVWLLAKEPGADLRHVYVIAPEAVSASVEEPVRQEEG